MIGTINAPNADNNRPDDDGSDRDANATFELPTLRARGRAEAGSARSFQLGLIRGWCSATSEPAYHSSVTPELTMCTVCFESTNVGGNGPAVLSGSVKRASKA